MRHIILGISDDGVVSIGGKEFEKGASVAGIDFSNLDFKELSNLGDYQVIQLIPIDKNQLTPIGNTRPRYTGVRRRPHLCSCEPMIFDIGARAVLWAMDNKENIDKLISNLEFKSVVTMSDININLYIQSKKYDRIQIESQYDLDKLGLPQHALDYIVLHQLTVNAYYSNGCILASNDRMSSRFLIHPDYENMTLLPCHVYLHKTRILAITDTQFVVMNTNEPTVSEAIYIPKHHEIIPDWFYNHGMVISVNSDLLGAKYAILSPTGDIVHVHDFEVSGDLLFAHTPYIINKCDVSIYNWKDNTGVNLVPSSMIHSACDYIILNDKYFLLKLSTHNPDKTVYDLFNSHGCVSAKSISEYFVTECAKESYLFTRSACTGSYYVFNLTGKYEFHRLTDVIKLERYRHEDITCYIATCNDTYKYVVDARGVAISSRYKDITTAGRYAVVDKMNGTRNALDLFHPSAELLIENYLYVTIIDGEYIRYGDLYDTIKEIETGKVIIDESQQYRFDTLLHHNTDTYFRLLDSTDALVAVPSHSPNNIAHLFTNIDVLEYLDIQCTYIDRVICMFDEEVVELYDVENHVIEEIGCSELEQAVILREIYKIAENDDCKLNKYTQLVKTLKTK
jgi:hypothetical protein